MNLERSTGSETIDSIEHEILDANRVNAWFQAAWIWRDSFAYKTAKPGSWIVTREPRDVRRILWILESKVSYPVDMLNTSIGG